MKLKLTSFDIMVAALFWVIFVCLGLLFFISHADAADLPVSEAKSNVALYDTMDKAARAAMDSIPVDSTVEYGGSIVRCEAVDGFFFTSAVSQEQTLYVSFETKVPKKWGVCTIVARYHSHPATAPYGEYFSPGDISTAYQEALPVYLLVCKDGAMKKYKSGISKTAILKISGHLTRVSLGEMLQ